MTPAEARALLIKSAEIILLFWYGVIYSFILVTALTAFASVVTLPAGWLMPLFTFTALLPSPALLLVFLMIAAIAVGLLVEERMHKRGMMLFATFLALLASASVFYLVSDTRIFKFLGTVCRELCTGVSP